MIYLASPYSNDDWLVRKQRFVMACRVAAALMQKGHKIFSAIAHSHPIAKQGLPTDWTFWEKYDREMIGFCDELWVLMTYGWEESKGVQAEIKIARELGMPIKFLNPKNILTTATKTTPTDAGAVEENFNSQEVSL